MTVTRFLEFPDFDAPIYSTHGPLDLTTWAGIRRAADLHGRHPFYRGQIIAAALEYAYTPELHDDFERYFEMCVDCTPLVWVHNVVAELEARISE